MNTLLVCTDIVLKNMVLTTSCRYQVFDLKMVYRLQIKTKIVYQIKYEVTAKVDRFVRRFVVCHRMVMIIYIPSEI